MIDQTAGHDFFLFPALFPDQWMHAYIKCIWNHEHCSSFAACYCDLHHLIGGYIIIFVSFPPSFFLYSILICFSHVTMVNQTNWPVYVCVNRWFCLYPAFSHRSNWSKMKKSPFIQKYYYYYYENSPYWIVLRIHP